jgi:hypothetical protein
MMSLATAEILILHKERNDGCSRVNYTFFTRAIGGSAARLVVYAASSFSMCFLIPGIPVLNRQGYHPEFRIDACTRDEETAFLKPAYRKALSRCFWQRPAPFACHCSIYRLSRMVVEWVFASNRKLDQTQRFVPCAYLKLRLNINASANHCLLLARAVTARPVHRRRSLLSCDVSRSNKLRFRVGL